MVLYNHIVYLSKQLNNYKMKQIIFALCLIFSMVMIGVSFTYANGLMLVGALLSTLVSWLLLWNEIKNNIKI
jgi:hypothetical protein